MKKLRYNWLPDFVYGGIDGSVTTFAVVMGVVGAELSTVVILALGFANLFADGISMAVGKYSSDKAEIEQVRFIKAQERRSIKENPKEEKQEIRDILRGFGFEGKDLTRAEQIITSDPDIWVHMMLHHEFHILEDNINPKKGAIATLTAFLLIGMIPLAAYVFQPVFDLNDQTAFWITVVGTLLGLFVVGSVKTQFTEQHWLRAGVETMAVGSFAAIVAYVVGMLVHQIAA